MKNAWFELFQEYLNNTNEAKLKEDWAKIAEMQYEGPTAYEYVEYLCRYYSAKRVTCHVDEVNIPENMTPDFSGSFF